LDAHSLGLRTCPGQQALPVDVVLLGRHGAMAADGHDYCEGDLVILMRV